MMLATTKNVWTVRVPQELEVNSNEQTVNNSGGPEKGRCVREEPRIF